MADEPKDMLAREIDEELRREQLLKIWDKYGTYILAAALLVVVGVGGWKYNEYRQATASEAASTRYIIALRDFAIKKPAEAQKALEELLTTAPPGYAALTRLRLAAYDRAEGNAAEALAAYEEVAKDSAVDSILADYARLQGAMLKLDSASFTEVKNQLTPLAKDENPWRYSARELLGMAAYKAGWPAEARNHFQRLLMDRTTPPGVSERAKVMMAVLTEAEQAKALPPATLKPEVPAKADPAKQPGSEAGAADKKKTK